jgi:4-amino-4-deoxy-L-arabinose transferase-like glycosyltransferase
LDKPFLPGRLYAFLFALLGVVYLLGMFVPLMDNDSAHHANIALRMHLTGDYVNLVDYGKDYLDKPHLHFWLAAFSYKIFGVTGFAYKFPSLLFTILGTYSTFRLGKVLYNKETGRLAALIIASSFAYILANNDVRMEAILTASIAFATWQLIEFIQHNKLLNVASAALGLALGFCTKGHIGVLVPAIAAFFYILYKKEWKFFLNWKWLVLLILFGLFISPVVYCYYQQYNLHPEKVVRGRDHIDGVKFILFGQSVERFQGDSFGSDSKNDYFFFLHSFLWAFAPWSIIAYIAVIGRVKDFLKRKEEWATPAVFVMIVLIVSFSGFKLPHYLNIVFPTTAVLTAAFIISKIDSSAWIKRLYIIQLIISLLLLLLGGGLTYWAFPVKKLLVIVGVIILLAAFFYFVKSTLLSRLQKTIGLSVSAMAFCFFLLNANFYPQLLKYQGGNELAFAIKGKVDPEKVYFWKGMYSSSFNFYAATLRKEFTDSTYQPGQWLLFDIRSEEEIKNAGYELGQRFEAIDFEITKLTLKFINPATRESKCTKMVLVELKRTTE